MPLLSRHAPVSHTQHTNKPNPLKSGWSLRVIYWALSGLCLMGLMACDDKTSQPTQTLQAASPQTYIHTPDTQLGTNENGKGLTVRSQASHSLMLKDIHGKPFHLAQVWQQRPALVIFYRGGWCPYCNGQVRALSENFQALWQAGVQPVLISVDSPEHSALINTTYKIPFPVLSDADLQAHKAFNVVMTLNMANLAKYRAFGIDLEDWSGRDHHSIAVASAFIVDQQGKVLMSHAVADYRQRPSVEQLLTLIQQSL